jgi:hypothetical protein
MLNLILFILIVVIIIGLSLTKKSEEFSSCSGVAITNIHDPPGASVSPLNVYRTTENQDNIVSVINQSIERGMDEAFRKKPTQCPKIPSDYISRNSVPPLASCPPCVCPKIIVNSGDLQECKADCPKVEPCPEKICPTPVPHVCPDTECTYLGIKGVETQDELFNVIRDMLKNNKCTKETLITGINSIFSN